MVFSVSGPLIGTRGVGDVAVPTGLRGFSCQWWQNIASAHGLGGGRPSGHPGFEFLETWNWAHDNTQYLVAVDKGLLVPSLGSFPF